MNIEAILKPLGDLERSLAELYGWYSDVFASDHEVALAFSRMSIEEQAHARLVDYQRKLVRNDSSLSVDVAVDLASLAETLDMVRSLRGALRPPTLDEAVGACVRLESSAAESHGRNALKAAAPHVAILLSALASEDQRHVDRIRALAARRGIPVPSIEVPAAE